MTWQDYYQSNVTSPEAAVNQIKSGSFWADQVQEAGVKEAAITEDK